MTTMPDANTTTREVFTQSLLDRPVPTNANEKYSSLMTTLQRLLNLLAHHEAMQPNLQQTMMTPANSKNKVYFMWDFVGRTLGMMLPLDPTLPSGQASAWTEVKGRVTMVHQLLTGPSGMIDMMMATTGGGGSGNVAFGSEIEQAAAQLNA